ncbi:MAG TPA: DinB family protein [Aridibacter sp.]|nr:DinB family protein [Aridibacter sp.]
MLNHEIKDLFVRDLNRAAEEIEQYPSNESLWEVRGEITNSAGNLGLHLAGNINHFFGAVLGNSGYVRERDLEFSSKGASRAEVADALRNAAEVAGRVLSSISEEDLANDYPEPFAGKTVSNAWLIAHLLTHLNYHLGQINYHRRLMT